MADAHGSGPCVRKDVGVQLPPSPRESGALCSRKARTGASRHVCSGGRAPGSPALRWLRSPLGRARPRGCGRRWSRSAPWLRSSLVALGPVVAVPAGRARPRGCGRRWSRSPPWLRSPLVAVLAGRGPRRAHWSRWLCWSPCVRWVRSVLVRVGWCGGCALDVCAGGSLWDMSPGVVHLRKIWRATGAGWVVLVRFVSQAGATTWGCGGLEG
jgi:hypothetical protein